VVEWVAAGWVVAAAEWAAVVEWAAAIKWLAGASSPASEKNAAHQVLALASSCKGGEKAKVGVMESESRTDFPETFVHEKISCKLPKKFQQHSKSTYRRKRENI
jgi:hypothetical protein